MILSSYDVRVHLYFSVYWTHIYISIHFLCTWDDTDYVFVAILFYPSLWKGITLGRFLMIVALLIARVIQNIDTYEHVISFLQLQNYWLENQVN